MPERPRILVIGPTPASLETGFAEVTVAASPAAAADMLRTEGFDAVLTGPAHTCELIDRSRRDETILANLDQGVASLDNAGRIIWANGVLTAWCPQPPVGKTLIEALGPCTVASESAEHIDPNSGRPATFRIHQPAPSEQPYIDVRVRPVIGSDGAFQQSVALLRNVSAEVEQQKKLDALHHAGSGLTDLDPDQLAEMNLPTRVELLKQNLRRYVHDLLHYDTIEVRLLNRRTGELMPLVQDGMTDAAAMRKLWARPEGNGVTGHVAFIGHSYLCPDTTNDPYYLEGAKDARSSLTVPLKHNDEVVGTLNVESPRTDGFGPDDLQFTELFSKEIAAALHTLDLLSAQQTCTLSQSIEAVNKEIALPVDEVLGSAALLYFRLHRSDPDAAKQLLRIMENARQVKECVNKVRNDLAADTPGYDVVPLAGKRILIVEQDERFRRQAHLMLGRLGAEVETVGDPLEGLALVGGDANYDAVFLELRPLGMSGYEAFRKFRLSVPEARVCLTTGFGYDSAHTIVKAKGDGLQHLLFKPFRADQVTTAVNAACPPPPMGLPVTIGAGAS